MRPEQMIRKGMSRPIEGISEPFQRFASSQVAGGVVLLACTAAALGWANSPWSASYETFWHLHLGLDAGPLHVERSLQHWINDGLMAVFFFVVGLEIKREVLAGHLSSPRKATLPIVAAVGGMIVPALFYALFTGNGPALRGWGVPMATDIAFALGILALLGDRVPVALRVFLAAVAIVDDIGAMLIIALGYSGGVSVAALSVAGIFLAALIVAGSFLHVRSPLPYAVLGIGLWAALLESGVHATLAGVLTAATIPARTLLATDEFLENGRRLLDDFARKGEHGASTTLGNERRLSVALALETACQHVQTPLQRLEHALQPWVSLVVMPVFALANAGVPLAGGSASIEAAGVVPGVLVGLVVGKQIGVTLFAWAAVRSGLASLPHGTSWRQVYGVSWLAGIGFTMSMFIANLAFPESAVLLEKAKLAILSASVVAAIGGLTILWSATRGAR